MHELSKRDASDDQYTRKAYANNIQHKYKLKWMIFCAICKFDKYVRLLSLMVTPKSNVCLSVSVSHGFFLLIRTPESDVTPKPDGPSPEESPRNFCNVST